MVTHLFREDKDQDKSLPLNAVDSRASSPSQDASRAGPGKNSCDPLNSQGICGPSILVVGEMKSGTNALYKQVLDHPSHKFSGIRKPAIAQLLRDNGWSGEVHFFDCDIPSSRLGIQNPLFEPGCKTRNSLLELEKYSFYFEQDLDGKERIGIDKSPSYLVSQKAAALARQVLPSAKVR